jgi:hypothetical protein
LLKSEGRASAMTGLRVPTGRPPVKVRQDR